MNPTSIAIALTAILSTGSAHAASGNVKANDPPQNVGGVTIIVNAGEIYYDDSSGSLVIETVSNRTSFSVIGSGAVIIISHTTSVLVVNGDNNTVDVSAGDTDVTVTGDANQVDLNSSGNSATLEDNAHSGATSDNNTSNDNGLFNSHTNNATGSGNSWPAM